jgi:hypothetical protein
MTKLSQILQAVLDYLRFKPCSASLSQNHYTTKWSRVLVDTLSKEQYYLYQN